MMIKKIALSVLLLWGLSLFTHFWGNLISLIAARGYEIPPQSNMLIFHETVRNSGSGEWWQYGEDYRYYYFNLGNNNPIIFAKKDIKNCMGFDSEKIRTWCGITPPDWAE